jgi:hypothetical protein
MDFWGRSDRKAYDGGVPQSRNNKRRGLQIGRSNLNLIIFAIACGGDSDHANEQ